MKTINELRSTLAEKPELLTLVNKLHQDQIRLNRLLFDLNRLDGALVQRVLMFQTINAPQGSPVRDLADNCIQLLVTISSFISMATTPAEERAIDAATEYTALMTRLMKR